MLDEDGTGSNARKGIYIAGLRKFGLALMGFSGAVALTILGSLGSVWDLPLARSVFLTSAGYFGGGALAGLGIFLTSVLLDMWGDVIDWRDRGDKLGYGIMIGSLMIFGVVSFGLGFIEITKIRDCDDDHPPTGCERQIERRIPPAFP